MSFDAETIMPELIIALPAGGGLGAVPGARPVNKWVLPTRCKLETLAQGDDIRFMPEIIFS